MTIHEQFITMFAMLASGLSMGIVFDGYRVVAHQFHFPKWTKPVLDLIYWIAAVGFIFRVLYLTNQGELRFYIFIGLFIGVWIYFLWLSFTTVRIVVTLVKIIQFLIRFILRCLDLIILKPVIGVLKLVRLLLLGVLRITTFTGRVMLHLLRPFWLLFRWMTRPIWSRWRTPLWMRRIGRYIVRGWHWLFRSREPRE